LTSHFVLSPFGQCGSSFKHSISIDAVKILKYFVLRDETTLSHALKHLLAVKHFGHIVSLMSEIAISHSIDQ